MFKTFSLDKRLRGSSKYCISIRFIQKIRAIRIHLPLRKFACLSLLNSVLLIVPPRGSAGWCLIFAVIDFSKCTKLYTYKLYTWSWLWYFLVQFSIDSLISYLNKYDRNTSLNILGNTCNRKTVLSKVLSWIQN